MIPIAEQGSSVGMTTNLKRKIASTAASDSIQRRHIESQFVALYRSDLAEDRVQREPDREA